MTKAQDKRISYTKNTLQKALKARLAALTQGLADADVGDKGIDLVKEIKELHAIIATLAPESTQAKPENTKIEVGWAEWENIAQNPVATDKSNQNDDQHKAGTSEQ